MENVKIGSKLKLKQKLECTSQTFENGDVFEVVKIDGIRLDISIGIFLVKDVLFSKDSFELIKGDDK